MVSAALPRGVRHDAVAEHRAKSTRTETAVVQLQTRVIVGEINSLDCESNIFSLCVVEADIIRIVRNDWDGVCRYQFSVYVQRRVVVAVDGARYEFVFGAFCVACSTNTETRNAYMADLTVPYDVLRDKEKSRLMCKLIFYL